MLLSASANKAMARSQSELRLCDLALARCGVAVDLAEKAIADKNELLKAQSEVIRSSEKVIVNQDVQIQDHESHMKRLPYYLLGTFLLGAFAASKL